MSKLIVESQYFPPTITFAFGLQAGEVCLEAHETYQKGGYRARCTIAGANGPITLSIPLEKGKNQQQNIRDTRIAYGEDWLTIHWQSIRSAYGRSPYFEFYEEALHSCLFRRPTFLWDLNLALWETLLALLQLPVVLNQTNAFVKAHPEQNGLLDLRGKITYRRKEEPVIWGRLPAYPQVFTERHGFLPDLSILDLLFCTGPEAVRYLQWPLAENK
jgi:hypothetical protein